MTKRGGQHSAEIAAERFLDTAVRGWRVALRPDGQGVWLRDETRERDLVYVELGGKRSGTVSVLGDVPGAVAIMCRLGAATEMAPELSAEVLLRTDELGELLDQMFSSR